MKSETQRERLVGNLALYGLAAVFCSFVAIALVMVSLWFFDYSIAAVGYPVVDTARSIIYALFVVMIAGAGMVYAAILFAEEPPQK